MFVFRITWRALFSCYLRLEIRPFPLSPTLCQFCFKARIGAHGITTDEIEYRSSYAFVGLTGPEKARTKMDWIREENSRAGDGPSIISVNIKAGKEKRRYYDYFIYKL